MKSSFVSTVLTGKSPEFTQPTLTALQLSATVTLVYSHARARMHSQAFEETHSRHYLIPYSNSSPGSATPSSQNGQAYTSLRTVMLPLYKEEETGESRDMLPFPFHTGTPEVSFKPLTACAILQVSKAMQTLLVRANVRNSQIFTTFIMTANNNLQHSYRMMYSLLPLPAITEFPCVF